MQHACLRWHQFRAQTLLVNNPPQIEHNWTANVVFIIPLQGLISGWGRWVIGDPATNPYSPDQLQYVISQKLCFLWWLVCFLLLQASVDIMPLEQCPALLQNAGLPPLWGSNQICVSDIYGDGQQSGGCQGDSGGPLAVQLTAGYWEVWGATSYGTINCNSGTGLSGVWAMVYGVQSWIEDITGGECPRN